MRVNYRLGLFRLWAVAASLWCAYEALIIWTQFSNLENFYRKEGWEITTGHVTNYVLGWVLIGPGLAIMVLAVGYFTIAAIEWIATGFRAEPPTRK